MGNFRSALYGVLTIALGACQDPLVVANSNNPDRGRVFNSAADLEQFIASGYARAHAGTLGAAERSTAIAGRPCRRAKRRVRAVPPRRRPRWRMSVPSESRTFHSVRSG